VVSIGNAVYSWHNRTRFLSEATPDSPEAARFLSTTFTAGLVFGLGIWLLAAAGTVVCAELTRRGRNPARIVLACLAGVFAVNNLCGATGGALMANLPSSDSGSIATVGSQGTWWSIAAQVLLVALGVAILVLVLVRPAGRYFSAGPGGRFAPDDPASNSAN
jgi:hypothetical protein